MLKKYANALTTLTLLLAVMGSLMIASAEMSSSLSSIDILTKNIIKQLAIIIIGIVLMFALSKFTFVTLNINIFYICYFLVLVLLVSTRYFGSINGAYGWIDLFGLSVQPAEIAKVFLIFSGMKVFGFNRKEKNKKYQLHYFIGFIIYFLIIGFVQGDYGSALIVFAIGYSIIMTSIQYETRGSRFWLCLIFILVVITSIIILSPKVTAILENKFSGNYIIDRIIASANPFKDQYNTGYHLIMSLISFATGGWFGLGYGQSIHKYMNFPNPSNDFILPVIVEEIGIIGFILIILLYGGMIFILVRSAYKCKNATTRVACVGTFVYLSLHFILNVGGVSGLIPLTGVPLLLLSSGGSSTVCFLGSIGICTCLLRRDDNESDSR